MVTSATAVLVCPISTTAPPCCGTGVPKLTTAGSLLVSWMKAPSDGDAAKVTVAVSPPPPITVAGLKVIDFRAGVTVPPPPPPPLPPPPPPPPLPEAKAGAAVSARASAAAPAAAGRNARRHRTGVKNLVIGLSGTERAD